MPARTLPNSGPRGAHNWQQSRRLPDYRTAIVTGHSARHLHALVSDVETYPKFIKWIRALRTKQNSVEGLTRYCVADAVVGFKGLTETFSTTVESDAEALTVQAGLVRGPFRKLLNQWHFSPLDSGGSRVDFYIDYEFSNPILRALAAANLELAVSKIITAFVTEADRRYGKPLQTP